MTQKRHTRRTRRKRQKGGGGDWNIFGTGEENQDRNSSPSFWNSLNPFHNSSTDPKNEYQHSNNRYEQPQQQRNWGRSLTDDTEPSYTLTTTTGGRCGKCGGIIKQKGGFSSHTNLANNAASFSGKTVGGRKRKSMKFCRRHHHLHCKSCKN